MIEWSTDSWNPTVGCSMVSPGCASCYAMKQAWRNHKFGTRGYEDVVKATPQGARWTGNVNFIASALAKPLTRRKPSLWFVNSMSDLFHEKVSNEQIAAVFGVMMATAARSQHYVVLTKRIERVPQWLSWLAGLGPSGAQACIRQYLQLAMPKTAALAHESIYDSKKEWPPKNVWIGPSIENKATASERLPYAMDLLRAGFNVVLSLEPLLEDISAEFRAAIAGMPEEAKARLWVLLGGESDQGADARPYDVHNWARPIIKQCAQAKIPLFHKQLGSNPINVSLNQIGKRGEFVKAWPEDVQVRQAPASLMPILEAAKRLTTKEPT